MLGSESVRGKKATSSEEVIRMYPSTWGLPVVVIKARGESHSSIIDILAC